MAGQPTPALMLQVPDRQKHPDGLCTQGVPVCDWAVWHCISAKQVMLCTMQVRGSRGTAGLQLVTESTAVSGPFPEQVHRHFLMLHQIGSGVSCIVLWACRRTGPSGTAWRLSPTLAGLAPPCWAA